MGRVALTPWKSVPLLIACELPACNACEPPACGEEMVTPWELVLTARGEALAVWALAPSAQEIPAWVGMALSPWALVPLPVWIACELPACGKAVLTSWELVLTSKGEVLAVWASAHSAWELVLTARGEALAVWASVHSAWRVTVLSPWGGLPACVGGTGQNQVIFPCF